MNIEKKLDKYLTEVEAFSGPAQGGSPPEPIPSEDVPGTYDPTREASNLGTGLKRLKYRLTMANTPAKFADAMALANQLVRNFPVNQKIAMVIDVIKQTPIRIMKTQ